MLHRRAPRPQDVAEAAELRELIAEQEARAQAAEVALHALRKEVTPEAHLGQPDECTPVA